MMNSSDKWARLFSPFCGHFGVDFLVNWSLEFHHISTVDSYTSEKIENRFVGS